MRRAFFIEGPLACCKRSEEHTSELQSQSNLVCRLLLEKKNHQPRVDLVVQRRGRLHAGCRVTSLSPVHVHCPHLTVDLDLQGTPRSLSDGVIGPSPWHH